jgi:hypothetical protein
MLMPVVVVAVAVAAAGGVVEVVVLALVFVVVVTVDVLVVNNFKNTNQPQNLNNCLKPVFRASKSNCNLTMRIKRWDNTFPVTSFGFPMSSFIFTIRKM